MMKTHYLIYQITNKINGKIYIGKHKTTDLEDSYFGSGKLLKRAIHKYGIENFEFKVLIDLNSELEMNLLEKYVVNDDFCNRLDTYNLIEGGSINKTTQNKFVIHNLKTLQNKFIAYDQDIPEGWIKGFAKNAKEKRMFTQDEDHYIMTHYINDSVKFCNTTRRIICRRIAELKIMFPDFEYVKAPNNRPGLVEKSKETCLKLSKALKNKKKSKKHCEAIGNNSRGRKHYTNGSKTYLFILDLSLPDFILV